ncbi:WD40 repeat-like protein [Phlegmacium glaucopus]|nr:WD40 repeat-like protein [Phlegmacium glaucopus]
MARSLREERCEAIVKNANGFPYSRKLQAHNSCVNALTFSSGEGRFLASGGDDQRIHLWDFYQDDVKSPSFSLRDLKGPLFCLEFSATNRFLLSGGSSDMVLKYDVEYIGSSISPRPTSLPSANQVFPDHQDSIRAITCHPVQDDLFMSASEDGRIIRHDGRSGGRSSSNHVQMLTQDVVQMNSEATGVQYHPIMEHIFVTSDAKGRVCLRDARMAFGSARKQSNAGVVLTYNTKITKKMFSHLSNPEASSVVFDREGKKLAVTFVHYLPTIYALSDPNPLAVLSGTKLPDGTPNPPSQRTYSNSCTMKHGSFGGPGLDTDDLYAAGSDDFRGYVWKIPPISVLEEQRKVFSVNEWENHQPALTEVAFTKSDQGMKYLPREISTPLCHLPGHKTIVNTAVFHPHFLHVVTAGVEKTIHLHSPTPSSPCTQDLSLSPLDVRQLNERDNHEDRLVYLNALMGARALDEDEDEDAGERQTICFFDHVLREEGQTDVFLNRRWSYLDSSSEEDSDSGDEKDPDDDEDRLGYLN